MPFATIHTRGLIPDFVISPILCSPSLSTLSTDSCGEEVHALHVSTILQKIFGYLSFWQQKKCRLVCRTWNAELHQSIRKHSKVNLTKLLGSISPNYHPSTLPSLLPTLQSLNLVCTSFIIENESQDIGNFLRNSNLLIKYIELRNITWRLSHVLKYILQELPYLEELRIPIQCALPDGKNACLDNTRGSPVITEQFPKLKTIVVTYTLMDFNMQATSVSPLLEILQSAPNLEEIYYPNIVQFTSPYENPARVVFKNIIYNGSMSLNRLTSLKIDTFLRNEDLYTLAERNLPLKSLQLTLTPGIGCDDLYELLYSVEHSLEALTFTFRDGYRLCKRFPHLENLRNMSVIVWNGYLENLAEIKRLTNLVVILMEVEMDMICSGNGGGNFAEKSEIKQLEIHAVPKGAESLVIKTIRLSPWNLRRLTIDHATDQYLRVIFRSLRLLEELLILYGDWSETGLTGIPKAHCKPEIVHKEFYAMGLKEYPGITDLKNLRNLILTGVMTDISLILGVTKCRTIRSLELVARSCSKVSDYALLKIADTMDLHYLRLTNFTPNINVPEEGLQYLSQRFSGRELYLNA